MKYCIINAPESFRKEVHEATCDVMIKQQNGAVVSYAHFVENLFKKFTVQHPGMNEPLIDIVSSLHHATTGLSGEAGEILDITKKCWVYGKGLDLANLLEELGDLRFYYQALLNMAGLTDEDVQAANMVKLSLGPNARYPNGVYTDADALARADKVAGERDYIGRGAVASVGQATAEKPPVTHLPATEPSSAALSGAAEFNKVKDRLRMGTLAEIEHLLFQTENPFAEGTVGHNDFRSGFTTAGLLFINQG